MDTNEDNKAREFPECRVATGPLGIGIVRDVYDCDEEDFLTEQEAAAYLESEGKGRTLDALPRVYEDPAGGHITVEVTGNSPRVERVRRLLTDVVDAVLYRS